MCWGMRPRFARMEAESYLLFRNFIPQNVLRSLYDEIMAIVQFLG